MADVMAIVSKAVFEKAAGKAPAVGTKLEMDRYVSANKNLEPVADKGRLFLVTVRPPDEALWLVAILEQPNFDGTAWVAKPSQLPITDITKLRDKLRFVSGTGITANPGALGMSLQTPRQLTPEDAGLLVGQPVPPPPNLGKQETGDRPRKDALIQAVLDAPDSDLARQVFADERILHEDPRGELILIELALAKPLSIRKRAQLTERRAALLNEHGKAWFPYKLAGSRRRGGFVNAATGTLGQLSAEELFGSEPIVDVTVTGIEGAAGAKKLAKAPWLARVQRLVVRGELGDDGFAALVPALGKVRSLNVTGNGIVAVPLGAHLPRCRVLSLTANSIGDAGMAQLAAWTHLPQVETLYLSKCRISSEGLAALLDASMPGLRKLCLSSNELGDDGVAVIADRATQMPNLERLELKNVGASGESVEKLLAAKLSRLRSIDVRVNEIEEGELADRRVRAGRN